jgi:hypothetical protein
VRIHDLGRNAKLENVMRVEVERAEFVCVDNKSWDEISDGVLRVVTENSRIP